MTDPIADMLTRIKNASAVKKETAVFGYSKIKMEIVRILQENDYLAAVERRGRKNRKLIEVSLKYHPDRAAITGIKRISKPSRRVYKISKDLKKIKQGFGMAIVSTSKGLKTDTEARKEHLGGEVICEVW
ncbi:30S ribosomal protein S8 [Candidatus Giovannonibacteria bacterium]|nr:30S ribosomal protein S8 [Candidatus Giovannonibacteria bacterium]